MMRRSSISILSRFGATRRQDPAGRARILIQNVIDLQAPNQTFVAFFRTLAVGILTERTRCDRLVLSEFLISKGPNLANSVQNFACHLSPWDADPAPLTDSSDRIPGSCQEIHQVVGPAIPRESSSTRKAPVGESSRGPGEGNPFRSGSFQP